MTVAALPNAETAGALVTLLVLMSLIFCGVFQTPTALPGFWIFMYRVSPFTYWIGGIVGTQLHARPVDCSSTETLVFDPPAGYVRVLGPVPFGGEALAAWKRGALILETHQLGCDPVSSLPDRSSALGTRAEAASMRAYLETLPHRTSEREGVVVERDAGLGLGL